MDNNLILSTCISLVFLVFKLIDTKLIKKETFDIKKIMKDVVLVFVSTFLGGFILEKVNSKSMVGGGKTQAFVDEPNF